MWDVCSFSQLKQPFLLFFVLSCLSTSAIGETAHAPQVTGVRPVSPNGTYGLSQTVFFEVELSEPLTFFYPENQQCFSFNPPRIQLNAGSSGFSQVLEDGRKAVFQFLVQEASQAHLNFAKGAKLLAPCGVRNQSGQTFYELSLPDSEGPDSLAAKSQYMVDGVGPRVWGISTPNPTGIYSPGETLDLFVKFDKRVTVTRPEEEELRLEVRERYDRSMAAFAGAAVYQGGSGTDTLHFKYEVPRGNREKILSVSGQFLSRSCPKGGALMDGCFDRQKTHALIKDDRGYPMPFYGNNSVPCDQVAGCGERYTQSPQAKNIQLTSKLKKISKARVKSVKSRSPNGVYGPGRPITLEVEFTEPVSVSGVPTLAVNKGTRALYQSGSGTPLLLFQYEPQVDEPPTRKLEYFSRSSLIDTPLLKGCPSNICAIKDLTGALVNLELPSQGGKGSLSAQSQIAISHRMRPKIIEVKYEEEKTEYRLGDRISILVIFDKPVELSKGLYFRLNNGGIAYSRSGSGTDTIRFEYLVGRTNSQGRRADSNTESLNIWGGIDLTDRLFYFDTIHPNRETTVRDRDGNYAQLSLRKAIVKLGRRVVVDR